MSLDELQTAYERRLETFYSPSQPRDREGQWTRGGGSGPTPDTTRRRGKRLDEWTKKQGSAIVDALGNNLESLGGYWQEAKNDGRMTARVRVPAGAISQIVSDGEIKTQHETGYSGGMFNPQARNEHEEAMFREPVRPIYGYMHVEGGNNRTEDFSDMAQYGQFSVVLKRDVLERSYLTVGDSLNQANPPAPLAVGELSSLKGTDMGKAILAASSDWSTGVQSAQLETRRATGEIPYSRIVDQSRYIEAQIVGGIKLSDIDYIIAPSDTSWGEVEDIEVAKETLWNAGIDVREFDGDSSGDYSASPLLAAARRRAAQTWLGDAVEGLTDSLVDDALELACHDASCAPPPVGTGGSKAKGDVRSVIKSATLSARMELAESTFNHELPHGFTSSVESDATYEGIEVIHRDDGSHSMYIEGKIRDADGGYAGHFERYLNIEPDGTLYAQHGTLVINPEHQGMGLAQSFTAQSKDKYREMGFERIELEASMAVGAFAWARQNYKFRGTEDERQDWVEDRLLWVKKVAQEGTGDRWSQEDASQMRKAAQDLINASNRGEPVQPIHVASLGEQSFRWKGTGYVEGRGGLTEQITYDTWPGKEVLLNWNRGNPEYGDPSWNGVEYLDRELVTASATELEEFYSPTQKRDKEGQWTSGHSESALAGQPPIHINRDVGVRAPDDTHKNNAEAAKFHGPRHVADSMDLDVRNAVTEDLMNREIPGGGLNELHHFTSDLGFNNGGPLPLGLALQAAHIYSALNDPLRVGLTWEKVDAVRGLIADYDDHVMRVTYLHAVEAATRLHDAIAEITGIDATAGLIGAINREWTDSSSGRGALAAHLVVAKTHGLDDAIAGMADYAGTFHMEAATRLIDSIGESNLKSVTDAMYASTQKVLNDLYGDSDINVYRGVESLSGISKDDFHEYSIQPNPLSSWTTASHIAESFAGDRGIVIKLAKIDKKDIFSLAAVTGMGSMDEDEVILLGRPQTTNSVRFINTGWEEQLHEEMALETVEELYSPTQPRDKEGQWTRIGDGIGGPGQKKGVQVIGITGYEGDQLSSPGAYKYHGPRHIADEMGGETRTKINKRLMSQVDTDGAFDDRLFGLNSDVINPKYASEMPVGLSMQVYHLAQGLRYLKGAERISPEVTDKILASLDSYKSPADAQRVHDELYALTGVDATTGLVGVINRGWQIGASTPISVAMHKTVAKIHGLDEAIVAAESYIWPVSWDGAKKVADLVGQDSLDAVAHTVYAATQRQLDLMAPNRSSITVFRGVNSGVVPGDDFVQPSPLSSWSTNELEARNFAGPEGALMKMSVDKADIYTLATVSGTGSLSEQEVIVLGKEFQVESYGYYYNYDGDDDYDLTDPLDV